MKKLILIFAAVAAAIWGLWVTDPVHELKSNPNAVLYCEFEDGVKIVDKNKIVAYDDERDVWAFTNGYAHNCWVERIDN